MTAALLAARLSARELAGRTGMGPVMAALLGAAVLELARNIPAHARRGEVLVRSVGEGDDQGVQVVARRRAGDRRSPHRPGRRLGLHGAGRQSLIPYEMTREAYPGPGPSSGADD